MAGFYILGTTVIKELKVPLSLQKFLQNNFDDISSFK